MLRISLYPVFIFIKNIISINTAFYQIHSGLMKELVSHISVLKEKKVQSSSHLALIFLMSAFSVGDVKARKTICYRP